MHHERVRTCVCALPTTRREATDVAASVAALAASARSLVLPVDESQLLR